KQTLVSDWVENHTERTSLIVAAGNISIESITYRRQKKNHDRGKSLPFKRLATLHTLAIIKREGDENRNQEDPDNRYLVSGSHWGAGHIVRRFDQTPMSV